MMLFSLYLCSLIVADVQESADFNHVTCAVSGPRFYECPSSPLSGFIVFSFIVVNMNLLNVPLVSSCFSVILLGVFFPWIGIDALPSVFLS